jgi:hypothetical protein
MPTSVEDWLKTIHFEKYWDAFQNSGLDMVEALPHVDTEMLEVVANTFQALTGSSMPPIHKMLLLKQAKDLVV